MREGSKKQTMADALNRYLGWLPVTSCGLLWLLFVLQNCTSLARELDFPKKRAPISCESSRSGANAVNFQNHFFKTRAFVRDGLKKQTVPDALNGYLGWLPVASCGWLWLLFVLQNCTTLAPELDFPKKQAPFSCEISRSRANALNYQSLFQNRSPRAREVEKTNGAGRVE